VGIVNVRRVGIFGGTFDPIHFGHLVVAENCWAQLGLDEVLFVPAGSPPHKGGKVISGADDRVAMVERAIADNDHFRLSRVDVDRPGVSYSVDTVRLLQAQLGPETQLFFIIGGDSLGDLPTWRDPSRLVELCQIVAVNRPGYPRFAPERLEPAIPRAGQRIRHLVVPELNIAASEIRRRVAAGEPIRYMVPEAVRCYIEERGLYCDDRSQSARIVRFQSS
jgi:nicotinate-nucleotide adenylyltransferase